ncbi:zinc finger protein 521 isoform X2 [Myxocyprinus asiaticus]|uniref:zinc finger protein 521 isoform X2 n=1 Tax=Myxocyprinus asiaticus TaxID=70543 RepID=UPI0022229245|nr:zinc finger protein 521 isoform X2 [Myxocyprinus asiaticus]
MSRRKQAKPRPLKGQDDKLNIKEDGESVGKQCCSWERKKERNDGGETFRQEKDEGVNEPKCAESIQVSESFTPQKLKYCHRSEKPNIEEDPICCLALPLTSGHSSPDHEDGFDLGFKVEDLPKCTSGEKYKNYQRVNAPLPGNSLVPIEISQMHIISEALTNSKQGFSDGYDQVSAMSPQHLSILNDSQNNKEDFENRQPPNIATPHSSFSSQANPMAFKRMAPCAEKRKSPFVSNNSFGIQFTKKLKVFNNCVHCHNHTDSRTCQQTQHKDMDKEIHSSQIGSDIPTFPSELKEHQKEANVLLGHAVVLEAEITAAVQTVLQCRFCPKTLKNMKALQEHVRQSHNSISEINSNVFFCSQCFRGFLTKDTLDNHVQQTHCKKSLSVDPDLSKEAAERKALLFCSDCTNLPTFSSKQKLMQHIKKTHKNMHLMKLQSEKRTQSPTSPQSIKCPVEKTGKSALPSTNFICDHCGAKYTSLDLFQTHLSSHLKSMLPKLTCPECFKNFPNQDSLNEHAMAHFNNTSTLYTCESCSKTFISVKDLHGHLLEMHTLEFYRCSLCQQVFSSKVSIQVHLASKHSTKRTAFHCTSCEWDCTQEHDLHVHVKQKHLDQQCKLYCCIFCSESFNTDIELQCHITTHSDKSSPCLTKSNSPLEVPLHEKLCAKSQGTEGNNVTPPPVSESVAKDSTGILPMNNEIRDSKVESLLCSPAESKGKVSRSDWMFACEICGASYTMQSLLANHQLRDHHIQPGESGTLRRKVEAIRGSHKCKDCSKTFFTEMALWEHVQTHLGPTKNCQCPICGERFPSLLTLTEHKVTHSRSLDTGNCRICKLPLHSEEDFLEHCQRHPDLHNSLTGFRCVVCMQTVTSTLELKIHGSFHMQKVQVNDLTSSCTDHSDLHPDLQIFPRVEMVNVSSLEPRKDNKTNISVVNCCSTTALIPEERSNKNALTQATKEGGGMRCHGVHAAAVCQGTEESLPAAGSQRNSCRLPVRGGAVPSARARRTHCHPPREERLSSSRGRKSG